MGPAPGGASPARRLPARLSVPLIVLDTGVVISALVGSRVASSYKVCNALATGGLRLAVSDRFFYEVTNTVRRKVGEGFIRDPAKAFEVGVDLGFHGEHHVFEPLPWPSVPGESPLWGAPLPR